MKKIPYFLFLSLIFMATTSAAQLFDTDSYTRYDADTKLLMHDPVVDQPRIFRIAPHELSNNLLSQNLSGLTVAHDHNTVLKSSGLKKEGLANLEYFEATLEDLDALTTILNYTSAKTHLYLNVIKSITAENLERWKKFNALNRITEIGINVSSNAIAVDLLTSWKDQLDLDIPWKAPKIIIYILTPPPPLSEKFPDTSKLLRELQEEYGRNLELYRFSEMAIRNDVHNIPPRILSFVSKYSDNINNERTIFDLFAPYQASSLQDAENALALIDTKYMSTERKAQLIVKLAGFPIAHRRPAAEAFQEALARHNTCAAYLPACHHILWIMRYFPPDQYPQIAQYLIECLSEKPGSTTLKFDVELGHVSQKYRFIACQSALVSITLGLDVIDAFDAISEDELAEAE